MCCPNWAPFQVGITSDSDVWIGLPFKWSNGQYANEYLTIAVLYREERSKMESSHLHTRPLIYRTALKDGCLQACSTRRLDITPWRPRSFLSGCYTAVEHLLGSSHSRFCSAIDQSPYVSSNYLSQATSPHL